MPLLGGVDLYDGLGQLRLLLKDAMWVFSDSGLLSDCHETSSFFGYTVLSWFAAWTERHENWADIKNWETQMNFAYELIHQERWLKCKEYVFVTRVHFFSFHRLNQVLIFVNSVTNIMETHETSIKVICDELLSNIGCDSIK